MIVNVAVFVSGRGSNLEAIFNACENNVLTDVSVEVVVSDIEDAYALFRANKRNVPSVFVARSKFKSKVEYEEHLLKIMKNYNIDLVVLAGFMRILGNTFISAYNNKIINIHPSLLPSFPGVDAQSQAFEYGVKYTGCTVHFVNEGVDSGPIIGQRVVEILKDDDRDSLAAKILLEEHSLLVECIDAISKNAVKLDGRKVTIL